MNGRSSQTGAMTDPTRSIVSRSFASCGYKSPRWGAHFEVTVSTKWSQGGGTTYGEYVASGWRPTTLWARQAAKRCVRRKVRADRRALAGWTIPPKATP